MFTIELVWNREFNWSSYGKPHNTLESAVEAAESIRDSGDGERVKKARVLDEQGNTVWKW